MIRLNLLALALILVIIGIKLDTVAFSQNILSNDYKSPTIIEVANFNSFNSYEITLDMPVNDLAIPSCGRLYPDFSSYISFKVPASKNMSVSLQTQESLFFGMAIYIEDEGILKEVVCDNFRSNFGSITLTSKHDYADNIAIARIWLIDGDGSPNIELGVFQRPIIKDQSSKVEYQSRQEYYSEPNEYNQKLDKLSDAHRQIGQLPYSTDYIFQHIFPEIRSERQTVAPNFPERGNTAEESDRSMQEWIKNFEDEYINYIEYLKEKLNYYQTKKSKSIE